MKRLIWSPVVVILVAAVAVPGGGLILFSLPLLAVGSFLVFVIEPGRSSDHHETCSDGTTRRRTA